MPNSSTSPTRHQLMAPGSLGAHPLAHVVPHNIGILSELLAEESLNRGLVDDHCSKAGLPSLRLNERRALLLQLGSSCAVQACTEVGRSFFLTDHASAAPVKPAKAVAA